MNLRYSVALNMRAFSTSQASAEAAIEDEIKESIKKEADEFFVPIKNGDKSVMDAERQKKSL